MNSTFVNHGRRALTVKVALAALLAACIAMAFGANHAKAAGAGDPFDATFNYAGLNVDVTLAQLDELVLTEADSPLTLQGTYDDANGNFTLPKASGLNFPDVSLEIDDGVNLDANIALASDGHGNYNDSTGVMSADLSIALTIGVSDVAALPLPGLGSGPLSCVFAPINVSFSTENGWPHDGSAFADPATIENGALAGAWRSKPKATVVPGKGAQATCDLISNVLKPVGGLWLANSSTPITTMPPATAPKPPEETCAEHNMVGKFPDCKTPPDPECEEGQIGTYPNCENPKGKITKVAFAPARGVVKAGKSVKLKLKVTNSGKAAITAAVKLKSSNRKVTVAKSLRVPVPAGKTVTKVVVVKANKKAKGKAIITASASGKSGKSTLTVKAAKKKRRR